MATRGESTQYKLCKEALRDVTTDRTITSYKRSIKQYAAWERLNPSVRALDPAQRVQRWERTLEQQGLSPASIHTKIAPVCKGFGVSMSEIDHPRRTSDHITRGRKQSANAQGRAEVEKEKFRRSVTLSRCSGLRRAELSKVKPSDLVKDESGHTCLRVKGKGGKYQLQRILPSHMRELSALAKSGNGKTILSKDDMGSHINYHSIRAEVAREAYDYYLSRLRSEPAYREQLKSELFARYDKYHRPGTSARAEFAASMDGIYKLRGANAERARSAGRPVQYERLGLLAVSVFHLSHWRLDVTVTNYMI